MPAGRPSKYQQEFAEQARKLCLLGATNDDLARFFDVGGGTIDRWIESNEEFRGALKAGRDEADTRVAERLYSRALGYSHEAVKIFMPASAAEPVYAPYTEHYPPDTTAAIFWLKNRRPDLWRDVQRQEHTGKDGGPIAMSVEDKRAAAKALLAETFGEKRE